MLKPECNVAVQRFTKYLPDGKMVNYSNGSQNVWGRKRLKREHLSVGLGLFVSTEIVVGIRINNTCSLFVISVRHTPLDTPAPETRPDETGGFWGIRQAAIMLSCDVGHVFFMAGHNWFLPSNLNWIGISMTFNIASKRCGRSLNWISNLDLV